jgi:undecaprenyl diphosphate synthase
MKKNKNNLPQHIAFIMDGNRRWARAHKFRLLMGHDRGAERIQTIVEKSFEKGIPYVTFWTFSTENWNRSKVELEMLFAVFRTKLLGPVVKRLLAKGVKLQLIGNYKQFPQDIVEGLEKVVEESKDNTSIVATLAINYGGRGEILEAVKKSGMTREIDEQTFSSYLSTKDLPDPDLVIRTGGEQRLSGFLPWQTVYSELYFTDTLWPDFDEDAFQKALDSYAARQRRFGK